ncbi:MAG TPA: hypothetical protein VD973_25740 [Symbiobacteriaceae bacterium]|nr:hypothetical protein [Symbiobacteriaceae bacterium]
MSKQQFYPYFARPGKVQLQIEPRGGQLKGAAGGGRITVYATEAAEVVLDVTATVPDEILRGTLHPSELSQPPAELRLVLQAIEARQRRSIRLTGTGGVYRTAQTLKKRDWCGTLHVQAFLVRNAANPALPPGYARDHGAMLASSDEIEILFDEYAAPPTGGLLENRWVNFAQADQEWLRRQGDNLFALDITSDPPVLFLNSAVDGAQSTLNSDAPHGRRARIRDLTFNLIAHQVWSSLLGMALTELAAQGLQSGPDALDVRELTRWQQAAIQEWLPHLYPEIDSREDALSHLYADLRGHGWTRSLLVHRLPEALQQRFKTGERMAKAATEVWE